MKKTETGENANERQGTDPFPGARLPTGTVSADFHERNFEMGREKKTLTEVTADGSRLDQLKTLADQLARSIDVLTAAATKGDAASSRQLAAMAKQYRETIREVEEIEGSESSEDEISKILGIRQAAGKPGAVRKNRS